MRATARESWTCALQDLRFSTHWTILESGRALIHHASLRLSTSCPIHIGKVFGSTSCESLPEADTIFLSCIFHTQQPLKSHARTSRLISTKALFLLRSERPRPSFLFSQRWTKGSGGRRTESDSRLTTYAFVQRILQLRTHQ